MEPRTLLTGLPYGAHPQDTGEFMMGDVVATVVDLPTFALEPLDPPVDVGLAIGLVDAGLDAGLRRGPVHRRRRRAGEEGRGEQEDRACQNKRFGKRVADRQVSGV